METLKQIWKFLDGKKTHIAGILEALLLWSIGRDWIAPDTAAMIGTILICIGLVDKGRKALSHGKSHKQAQQN